VEITGTTQQASANTGYIAKNPAQVTITQPNSLQVGGVEVVGRGAGGWKIVQNEGRSILGMMAQREWKPRAVQLEIRTLSPPRQTAPSWCGSERRLYFHLDRFWGKLDSASLSRTLGRGRFLGRRHQVGGDPAGRHLQVHGFRHKLGATIRQRPHGPYCILDP